MNMQYCLCYQLKPAMLRSWGWVSF